VIRQAEFKDINRCVSLAIESIKQAKLPLEIDERKIKEIALVSIHQRAAWVSEEDGIVNGVVGGILNEGSWFKGKQFDLVIFYCKNKNGILLLKKMRDWLKEQKIDFATVHLEWFMDKRYESLFVRLGFKKPLTYFTYIKDHE
jgi:hypothetical protein